MDSQTPLRNISGHSLTVRTEFFKSGSQGLWVSYLAFLSGGLIFAALSRQLWHSGEGLVSRVASGGSGWLAISFLCTPLLARFLRHTKN